jgi:hypothetical protein
VGEAPEPTGEPDPATGGAADGAPGGTTEPPARPHPPSPPWYGAIASAALLLSVLWLLSYTLLDWGWQQRIGAWNYLVAGLLSAVPGRMLEHWHGEPHRE